MDARIESLTNAESRANLQTILEISNVTDCHPNAFASSECHPALAWLRL